MLVPALLLVLVALLLALAMRLALLMLGMCRSRSASLPSPPPCAEPSLAREWLRVGQPLDASSAKALWSKHAFAGIALCAESVEPKRGFDLLDTSLRALLKPCCRLRS